MTTKLTHTILIAFSFLLALPEVSAQSRIRAGGYFGSMKVGGQNIYQVELSKTGAITAGYTLLSSRKHPDALQKLKPLWLSSRIQAVAEDCMNPTVVISAEPGTPSEEITKVVSICLVHSITKINISAPVAPQPDGAPAPLKFIPIPVAPVLPVPKPDLDPGDARAPLK